MKLCSFGVNIEYWMESTSAILESILDQFGGIQTPLEIQCSIYFVLYLESELFGKNYILFSLSHKNNRIKLSE